MNYLMNRRSFSISLLSAVGASSLLESCSNGYSSFRFMMKVQISVNGKSYSSASVIEDNCKKNSVYFGEYGSRLVKLRGQAVVVDPHIGPIVLALLSSSLAVKIPTLFLPINGEINQLLSVFNELGSGRFDRVTKLLDEQDYPSFAIASQVKGAESFRKMDVGQLRSINIDVEKIEISITSSGISNDILTKYPYLLKYGGVLEK